AEQNIGDGAPAFLPEIPAFEESVGALREIIHGERTAVEQQNNHGFSGGEHRLGEFLLGPNQIQAGTIAQMFERPRFARGLFVPTEREDDHIGVFYRIGCFGNPLALLLRVARKNFIALPGTAIARDFATLAVDHFGTITHFRANAFQNGDVAFRHATVATEQRTIGVRADYGDGAQFFD